MIVGQGVEVNALNSNLSGQSALTVNYHWNFGDTGSAYNDLTGWNAGHIYDKPGVYTITLVMTDVSGKTATTTSSVTVASDNRPVIYVDNVGGSDSNNGLSPTAAVKTPGKAFSLITSNAQVLLHRGQTWNLNQTLSINGTNVTVGATATAAPPTPTLVRGVGDGFDCFYMTSTSSNIVIQDITFDSIWPAVNNVADKLNASGIEANGTNLVVRGCTFLNITDAVNGEMKPDGVIMLDNSAPLASGLRGYFAWLDGRDWTLLGNYAYTSTREHIVRGNSNDPAVGARSTTTISSSTSTPTTPARSSRPPSTSAPETTCGSTATSWSTAPCPSPLAPAWIPPHPFSGSWSKTITSTTTSST